MDDLVIDVRDAVQFFLDDAVIAASRGLERRVHQLTKRSAEPVLQKTEPYEGTRQRPIRVLWDEDQSRWRMWYDSSGLDHPGMDGVASTQNSAVSEDGIHWEKPSLGLFELDGERDNNINVWADGSPAPGGCAVFDEPEDPDPSRRYKMIYYPPGMNYYLTCSADGTTWRPAQKDPVWRNGAGDGLEETNFFMRDERVGRYRGYMRVWQRHQTIRTTSLGESEDLVHWTGPKIIWQAGPEFGPGAQIYGMNVFIDGGLYWALPWMCYTDEPLEPRWRQTIRFKLGWSRDGVHWHPLEPEQDALPLGEAGAFDEHMMISSCPMVPFDERWRFYYMGMDAKHDAGGYRSAVGLAEIRRGGFVSLRAGGEEAVLLTKRMLFRGEELRINARTDPGGSVAAELLNDGGGVMKLFSLDQNDVFAGDDVDHVLSWRGRSDLSPLIGQNVMLRLHLRRADLYSFRVVGKPERFSQPIGPAPVRCGRCQKAPVIDGVLGDDCWQNFSNTGVADEFVKFTENVPAPIRTRVSLTHDDTNLYIGVDCEEPCTERLAGESPGEKVDYHREDLIELRFSAPGQGTFFNQLMVTASGKLQHCWFSVEEGGSKELDHIDWQAKTSVVSGHWYAELAVPFAVLGTHAPEAAESWQMNVIRFRYTEGREVSCWSCMFGSLHRNDLSGRLIFID